MTIILFKLISTPWMKFSMLVCPTIIIIIIIIILLLFFIRFPPHLHWVIDHLALIHLLLGFFPCNFFFILFTITTISSFSSPFIFFYFYFFLIYLNDGFSSSKFIHAKSRISIPIPPIPSSLIVYTCPILHNPHSSHSQDQHTKERYMIRLSSIPTPCVPLGILWGYYCDPNPWYCSTKHRKKLYKINSNK